MTETPIHDTVAATPFPDDLRSHEGVREARRRRVPRPRARGVRGSDDLGALRSSEVRIAAFPLVREATESTRSTPALGRVEDAFAARERDYALSRLGARAWVAETRDTRRCCSTRLRRPRGVAFDRVGSSGTAIAWTRSTSVADRTRTLPGGGRSDHTGTGPAPSRSACSAAGIARRRSMRAPKRSSKSCTPSDDHRAWHPCASVGRIERTVTSGSELSRASASPSPPGRIGRRGPADAPSVAPGRDGRAAAAAWSGSSAPPPRCCSSERTVGLWGHPCSPLRPRSRNTVTLYAEGLGAHAAVSSSGEKAGPQLDRASTTSTSSQADPDPTPAPSRSKDTGSESSSGSSGPVLYSGGGAPAEWMAAAGISESDMGFVDLHRQPRERLESPMRTNRSSGAVWSGPGSSVRQGTRATATTPSTKPCAGNRIRHCRLRRLGPAAYAFWTANHWW